MGQPGKESIKEVGRRAWMRLYVGLRGYRYGLDKNFIIYIEWHWQTAVISNILYVHWQTLGVARNTRRDVFWITADRIIVSILRNNFMLIRSLLTPTHVVKLMNAMLINFQQQTIYDYYHYCCYYRMFLQTASCTHAHSLASYMFWNECHQILATLTGAGVILLCVYTFSTTTTEQNRCNTQRRQMPCPRTKPMLINYKIPKSTL
jgi:hypothetical protein